MTDNQRLIKYLSIALAVVLILVIFSGIAKVLRIFYYISEGDGITDEGKIYEVSPSVTDLDIEISAAELTVKTGDRLYIESNLKRLTVKENGSTVTVTEKPRVNYKAAKAFLTIYLPEDHSLNEVEINAGAGKICIEALNCRELSLDLGAGDFDADTLVVTDGCQIHGGVGEFTLHSGTINDLEMEMGVGNMVLKASLLGDCDLSFGVGNASVTLMGDRNDYRLKVEKGIGAITLDGNKISNGSAIGDGINRINIEGGIGNTDIIFGE